MADNKTLAANFLQKQTSVSPAPVAKPPINPFRAVFEVQELNENENRAIEKILVDGYEPGLFAEVEVEKDLLEVKQITTELKAIRKQEIILIGERVAKARDVFKKYKDGSFREWMELTFGSFKTGYNYVAFFDLYRALPDRLKSNIKEMPARAAYVLASKDVPIQLKAEIVEKHYTQTAPEIISIIQANLGSDESRQSSRKSLIDKAIASIERDVAKLASRQVQLDEGQRNKIRMIIEQLQTLSGEEI